jgi:hypothetical protein
MRTLNRPMFRYGGPIKEGVMNGIREPKKDGGSMSPQFNTGLVGDERYPKTDGRENHAFFLAPFVAPLMAAARAAPAVYRGFKAAKTFAPGKLGKIGRLKDIFSPSSRFRTGQVPSQGNILSPAQIKAGMKPTLGKRGIMESLKDPSKFGAAIRENPFTALSALTLPNMALSAAPIVGKGALGAGKMFIDAVLPGEQFRGDEKETEGAVLEKLTTDTIEKVLSPAEEKALAADKKAQAEAAAIAGENFAKAQKEKRIEGYREIMDIKGMNKDAAYNSLIAASQAVLGEGDFKGSLKDGSLINKIIGTTSQAFDKPAKTKDAINSLILKGEIEKNINEGKEGSQMKAAKDFASAQGISVTQAYKDLGFSKTKNLSENIAIVSKSQGGIGLTTDSVAEGLRMTYPELGVPQIIGTDAELIKLKKENSLYKDQNDAAIFEDLAVKNKLGDGLYVLGTSSFTITDGKLDQLR